MKVSDRLDLIDKIGRELQSRYTYTDIDVFLKSFEVSPPTNVSANSKWVYSKEALANASAPVIIKMAKELGIESFNPIIRSADPPGCWSDPKKFRLFISHLAKNKDKAKRLKQTLVPYGISSFVAHEDIEPTLEWQDEILKGLNTMEAMLTIHTNGFSASNWTQQEVGYALGRGIKIVSFKMDEDPSGFISRHQAILWNKRNAEEIAKVISDIFYADPLTAERMKAVNAEKVFEEEIPF